MKKFADLSKVVSTDKLRPAHQFAVVLNNKLIATDSHVLAIIDLKLYIEDKEQLKNIEGKIFDAKLLKRLSKADSIEFLDNSMILTEKKNISQVFYPGEIAENREMFYNHEKTGVKLCASFGFYPNVYAVIPGYDQKTGKIDFSNYERKVTAFNIAKLNNLITGFRNENHFIISNLKNKPAIVLPIPKEGEENVFGEIGLIMPVIGTGLDLTIFDLNPEPIKPVKNTIEVIDINVPAPAKKEPKKAPATILAKDPAPATIPAKKPAQIETPVNIEPAKDQNEINTLKSIKTQAENETPENLQQYKSISKKLVQKKMRNRETFRSRNGFGSPKFKM